MNYTILQGDNRLTLKTIPDNSIDAIVTDPPYGIDFLGKAWDANTGALETYQECLRVLKPGGHILAFSAARTYHHLAITLEQAGFEIRDQIMWIYSSGFPKSQDVGKSIDRAANKASKTIKNGTNKSRGERIEGFDLGSGTRCPECKRDSNARYSCDKGNDCGMVFKPQTEEGKQWAGWGTALKPAHEPIALARKPMKLSIAKNCQEWGVGALNIDATRVPYEDGDTLEEWKQRYPDVANGSAETHANFNPEKRTNKDKPKPGIIGRDPRNNLKSNGVESDIPYTEQEWIPSDAGRFPANVIGEIPDYQKYFYCPKVSRKERHIGHEAPPVYDRREEGLELAGIQGLQKLNGEKKTPGGNNHPTVKPVELMKYLIKLITPPGGTVLDPFNGSGSTGMAAVELGHSYIGCELDPHYVEIARTRIEAWYQHTQPKTNPTVQELFE